MGNLIASALGYISIAVFFGMIFLGFVQSIMMLFDEKTDPQVCNDIQESIL